MPFLPTVLTLLSDHEAYLRAAAEAFLARLPDAIDEHARATRSIGLQAAVFLVESPWEVGTSEPSIAALIDAYNRVNPPSLLFTLFLLGAADARQFRVMEPPLPSPPVRPDSGALLADIAACHGSFKLPGFWRELMAGWPEEAACAWTLVRRLPENNRFARARDDVRSLDLGNVPRGAAPAPSELGCSVTEAGEIASILSFYAVVIPTMVIEIECLRHALALAARDASPGRER